MNNSPSNGLLCGVSIECAFDHGHKSERYDAKWDQINSIRRDFVPSMQNDSTTQLVQNEEINTKNVIHTAPFALGASSTSTGA